MEIVLMGGGKYAGFLYSMFSKQYDFIGYIDDVYDHAYVEEYYPLKKIGRSSDLERILGICPNVCIAIGSEGDVTARPRYFKSFSDAGFSFPALIHSSVITAENSEIGCGTVIQFNCVVLPVTKIGRNCVISAGSLIGHDIVIGDNVYVAPGVIINGSCEIGDNSFIGAGATIIQKTRIGKNCVVGAGACVIRDVPDNQKVAGVPARPIQAGAKTKTIGDIHHTPGTRREII